MAEVMRKEALAYAKVGLSLRKPPAPGSFSFNTKSFCNKSADFVFSPSCPLLAQSSEPTRRSFTEKGRSPGSTSRCLPPPSPLSPPATEVTAHTECRQDARARVGAIVPATHLGRRGFLPPGLKCRPGSPSSTWALPLEKPLDFHSLPSVLKPRVSHFKRR